MEKKVLQVNHRTNPRYEMSKNKTKVGNSHKKNIQVVEKKWKERDNLHREIIQIK